MQGNVELTKLAQENCISNRIWREKEELPSQAAGDESRVKCW